MKRIEISFITWARCTKEVEVDDDYKLDTENSIEFLQKLYEEYEEQFWEEIVTEEFNYIPAEISGCDVEQVGLEYVDYVNVYDSSDNMIEEKSFNKIKYS